MSKTVELDIPDGALTSPGQAISDRFRWENQITPVLTELMSDYLEYVRKEVSGTFRADSAMVHEAYEDIVVTGVVDSLRGEVSEASGELSAFLQESDTPDQVHHTVTAILAETSRSGVTNLLREALTLEGQQLQQVPDEESESLSAALGPALVGARALKTYGPRWAKKAATTARSVATAGRGVVAQNKIHQSGSHHKRWISRRDHRVRDSHALADGQTVPLNSTFQVGTASLMVPGDRRGPPDEIINCRCVIIAA